ncbi:MAG: hypothetical protein ABI396_11370 [Ktedonobacteraceae bacterium]
MPNRLATYQTLLRIIGIVCILAAFYDIAQIAAGPLFPFAPDYISQTTPLIEQSLTETLFNIVWAATPLILLAAGLVILNFSFHNARIVYWSTQLAVWLVGMAFWFRFNNFFTPFPNNPIGLIITAFCSLILLLLYKKLVRWLSHLLEIRSIIGP